MSEVLALPPWLSKLNRSDWSFFSDVHQLETNTWLHLKAEGKGIEQYLIFQVCFFFFNTATSWIIMQI